MRLKKEWWESTQASLVTRASAQIPYCSFCNEHASDYRHGGNSFGCFSLFVLAIWAFAALLLSLLRDGGPIGQVIWWSLLLCGVAGITAVKHHILKVFLGAIVSTFALGTILQDGNGRTIALYFCGVVVIMVLTYKYIVKRERAGLYKAHNEGNVHHAGRCSDAFSE